VSSLKSKETILLDKLKISSLSCKLQEVKNRTLPSFNIEIPMAHLEEDAQEQIGKILSSRQDSYRSFVNTTKIVSLVGVGALFADFSVACGSISSAIELCLKSHNILPMFGPALVAAPIMSRYFIFNHKTNDLQKDLSKLIDQKHDFIEIVKPKYQEHYRQLDLKKGCFFKVSTSGSILLCAHEISSFQKKYVYHYKKPEEAKV
jgi:hypothetical protein